MPIVALVRRRARPGSVGELSTIMAVVAVMAVAAIAAGCQARTVIPDDAGSRTDEADGSNQQPGRSGGADAASTATPEATTAPELDLAAIYADRSSSIVFIETPDETSGTGIVVEGGWILTNAHVVERFESVRVGRSDGVDLGEHEVVGLDWIFDLAIIGPVTDDGLVPFERVASSEIAIGDTVMLLGFPDEKTSAPTPTLTSGIVSRRRRPAIGDFPFLQVDATIAPGQSGGALIDADGRLVGISGIEFGLGEFGLALEADPMWPRVDRMLASPGPSLPSGPPEFSLKADIGPRRRFGFLLQVGDDEELDLLVVSEDDVFVDVQSLGGLTATIFHELEDPFVIPSENDGKSWFVDELLGGGEELIGPIDPGVYQVVVGSFGDEPKEISITSRNELRTFDDIEEGAPLPTGTVVEGEIDWAGDSDRWRLDLDAGDEVTITADGIADTLVAVRLDGVPVAASDDESLGLFGTGSRLEFVAADSGSYVVEVASFDDVRWGYLIHVEVE